MGVSQTDYLVLYFYFFGLENKRDVIYMEHVLIFPEAVKFFIGLVSMFGLEVQVLSYFSWFCQVLPVPLK